MLRPGCIRVDLSGVRKLLVEARSFVFLGLRVTELHTVVGVLPLRGDVVVISVLPTSPHNTLLLLKRLNVSLLFVVYDVTNTLNTT